MNKIALFDVKPYDRKWFDWANNGKYDILYFEEKLSRNSIKLAEGIKVVCPFVNDDLSEEVLLELKKMGVQLVAMRSAGYNNLNVKRASELGIKAVRVPAYSPHAVAEHAMALLLTLNRKTHKAYLRTRDFNFSLARLDGIDLYNKTVGVIGTGKIGRVFIDICKGFHMNVIAYDPYPDKSADINYVSLDELFEKSDVISLHCPLTESTKHIINEKSLSKMKDGVIIINTSRGALIDSEALLGAIDAKKVGLAGLDVYEEESDLFFEDNSDYIIRDDLLALLISKPNVLITSHQAFLTQEALQSIAKTTIDNIDEFFDGKKLTNEILP